MCFTCLCLSINFCRENGIVLLTIPPHTSHRLQPLDRTVLCPLKNYVSESCAGKMQSQAGRPLTIYDIPSVMKDSLPRAVTIANVCSGFECTGIFPYNRNVFFESMFAPSAVTDREDPNVTSEDLGNEADVPKTPATCSSTQEPEKVPADVSLLTSINVELPGASTRDTDSSDRTTPCTPRRQLFSRVSIGEKPGTSGISVTPEMVKPLSKAGPRKPAARGRRKRRALLIVHCLLNT